MRARRFDRWAAGYDGSQLQAVLYGPVHEAVLRHARLRVPRPRHILDVGCGTGRLAARTAHAYQRAQVAAVDASTEMIRNAAPSPDIHYVCAMAERLPFASAAFDLVLVTFSVSHWLGKAAGLAEIGRVLQPGATVIAAEVLPARPARPFPVRSGGRRLNLAQGLPAVIIASGLSIHHVQPIPATAIAVNTVLIAAGKRTRHGEPSSATCAATWS